MNEWIWGIAIGMCIYWLGTFALSWFGIRRLPTLTDRSTEDSNLDALNATLDSNLDVSNVPLVSIIVAAKDEEDQIENTIRQLWAQNYPRLEWIVVNDRSVDRTAAILEKLNNEWTDKKHSNDFQVVHIQKLPDGWLGKNHALWQGVQKAKGEWLLFVDADIQFEPQAVQAAMAYVESNQVDHLTLAPRFLSRTFFVRAFVGLFLFSLNLVLRPWRCNDDRHKDNGVGVGAFNLLKRSVYETIGTHRSIAMRPDDDLILGKRVKSFGFRQRFVLGNRFISVEWYPTVNAAILGLEKNVFAGFGYSIPLASVMIFGFFFQFHLPFWMLGIGWFWADWSTLLNGLFLIVTLFQALAVGWTSWRFNRASAWDILLLPWTSFMVGYTLLRSVWLANWRGGVYWRGTFYDLNQLKKMSKSGQVEK